jgi:hypothetical protein
MTPEPLQPRGLTAREPLRTIAVAAASIAITLAATASILGGLAIGARLGDRQGDGGNRRALQALRSDSFPHGAIDRRSPFTVRGAP